MADFCGVSFKGAFEGWAQELKEKLALWCVEVGVEVEIGMRAKKAVAGGPQAAPGAVIASATAWRLPLPPPMPYGSHDPRP